jgi:hypothetical protein
MEGFYKVVFECSNCKYRIVKEFPTGIRASGNAGICPNCHIVDEATHPFNILSTIQKEILME